MSRFYCPTPLAIGQTLALSANAARHVQVLRLQPGMSITVFNGQGGEYQAVIQAMSRSSVSAQLTAYSDIEREVTVPIHLALGVPANERMDWLVEKATELGVASIQPLMTERGVVRLTQVRAAKKQGHWQAISHAACEQSGRNRVPIIWPVQTLIHYLQAQKQQNANSSLRLVLSFQAQACALHTFLEASLDPAFRDGGIILLSGAEGGLTSTEESLACAQGYIPASLGARVLRAETAAIAALATFSLGA